MCAYNTMHALKHLQYNISLPIHPPIYLPIYVSAFSATYLCMHSARDCLCTPALCSAECFRASAATCDVRAVVEASQVSGRQVSGQHRYIYMYTRSISLPVYMYVYIYIHTHRYIQTCNKYTMPVFDLQTLN